MKKGKRTRERYKMIGWQGILLFAAILFMTIAYAQISGIIMKIEGGAEAELQDGVFIAEAVSQDTANGKVNYCTGTILSSNVTLESSTSSVTYEITMYNNTSRDYVFIGTLTDGTDETLYSNANIGYTINGLTEHVTTIAPKTNLKFTITFAYNTGASTTNNVLESIINFRFKEVPILELSINGKTYTLENIYPGYTQEYEFTVSNYNKTTNNTVPMKYSFETRVTEGSPIEVKIYNESGEEVTGEIEIGGESQEDHKYTAKIIWDESKDSTEYEGQEYTCNIILKAKPTDEKYLEYTITKAFNVEITTCAHNYGNGACTICGKACSHSYGEWETVTEATCVVEGSKQRICTICEKIETQRIMGEHQYQCGECTICGRAKENILYINENYVATIPSGFTVSGVKSEQTIENGLVIYQIPEGETVDWTDGTAVAIAQKTYDQFVWIPVNDINDMYMCKSEDGTKSCKITVEEVDGEEVAYCITHNSTAMAGRLYGTNVGETYTPGLSNQIYTDPKEPGTYWGINYDLPVDGRYLGSLNEVLGTSYETIGDFGADLQSEYNKIVKSVYQNKGFYVGRYETSNVNIAYKTAVKVIAGTQTNSYSSWYYMYAKQRVYATYKGIPVGSTMIQGAAYDQVMKFVDDSIDGNGNIYDVTTYSSARHSESFANTGANLNDKVKNIYDLEGNRYQWTTEVFDVGVQRR